MRPFDAAIWFGAIMLPSPLLATRCGVLQLIRPDVSVFQLDFEYAVHLDLPGRHGLVADANDDFKCENPGMKEILYENGYKSQIHCLNTGNYLEIHELSSGVNKSPTIVASKCGGCTFRLRFFFYNRCLNACQRKKVCTFCSANELVWQKNNAIILPSRTIRY